MKKIIFTISIIFLSLISFSQEYEIKVKISGVSDTIIYLVNYFGQNTYIIDTARIDSKGNAVFTGDIPLNRGIYMVAMPSENMNYFEFLIADSQSFSIETQKPDYYQTMKIKGNNDAQTFVDYQIKMMEIQKRHVALAKEFEKSKDNIEAQKDIEDKLKQINKERKGISDSIITSAPESLFGKILKSMQEIEIPDPPKDNEGNIIDPSFQYLYVKEHFFDNIDFAESGLIRTPIYEDKLNYYLKYMVAPTPDSLIKETHNIINKAYEGGDPIVFQYTLTHLFNTYDTISIMGYDEIFVAIAEDWVLSGKAGWDDPKLLEIITERVESITPNKIGSIAQNLERMQGIDDRYYSLYQFAGDYTILVFYEPDCSTCKIEIPKLMKEFRSLPKELNVKVFAVYLQYNKKEWEKFLNERNLYENGWYNVWDGPYPHSNFREYYDVHNTPAIFVIDKDKKIIGKKIGAENARKLIEINANKKNLK